MSGHQELQWKYRSSYIYIKLTHFSTFVATPLIFRHNPYHFSTLHPELCWSNPSKIKVTTGLQEILATFCRQYPLTRLQKIKSNNAPCPAPSVVVLSPAKKDPTKKLEFGMEWMGMGHLDHQNQRFDEHWSCTSDVSPTKVLTQTNRTWRKWSDRNFITKMMDFT